MSTSAESDNFVTLIASLRGTQTVRREVRKDVVIQSESLFLKEQIEDEGATEIKIPIKRPENLNVIIDYLYEGQLNVSAEDHLESLWNDARILGLVTLEKFCIQQLTDTISLDSWLERLKFSQAEGCHELESNVISFVQANFDDCSTSPSFASLSVDQMFQVLQLPTVKTTVTESNRIALILDWIKANEVERSCLAHRLLEEKDLMKLTEISLRSFFDEESAFRSWRSVAIFQRAIRLQKIQESAIMFSHTVPAESSESEPVEAGPAAFKSLDTTINNIKQEVASEEFSSHAQVDQSVESIMNHKDSGGECRIGAMQEFSPTSTSSVCETVENNEDDPLQSKMPSRECSQKETEAVVPSLSNQIDFVDQRKQILYFSQGSEGATSLNSVIVSADSISSPQQVLASFPEYILGVSKLIWDGEAQNLCFLGYSGGNRRKVPSLNYMNGEGAPKVTLLPRMDPQRHHHQPVLLDGFVFVVGGSESGIWKNNDRFSTAEVLNIKSAGRGRFKWQKVAFTLQKRDLYAAARVQGNVYVTGGVVDRPRKDEPGITNHFHCYQPKRRRWKYLSPMKNPRCGHALAVLGHRIYVFGGRQKDPNDPSSKDLVSLKSAEVYEVHRKRWTLIAPMPPWNRSKLLGKQMEPAIPGQN